MNLLYSSILYHMNPFRSIKNVFNYMNPFKSVQTDPVVEKSATKNAKEEYLFAGTHFLASYKGCNNARLTDIANLKEALESAVVLLVPPFLIRRIIFLNRKTVKDSPARKETKTRKITNPVTLVH